MYQKTTKPEPELSDWDKGAIAHAKTRLNDDGTIGAIVKKGPAADDWVAYFKWVGMRGRARFMKFHVETGGSFTLPTEFPHQYDPTFRAGRPSPKPAPKAEKPPIDGERLRWWDK